MMLTFKFQVFLMRRFWRIKPACSNTFAVYHNLHSPFSLMGADTQKTNRIGFSCFSHVLQITKSANLTQICKRVVQFVSVYMVNMAVRHFACDIKPRQSMCQPFGVMNRNRNVATVMSRACNFSDKIGAPVVFAPSKNAGLRVVIKRFAQMFNGNVGCNSHDIQFTIKAA